MSRNSRVMVISRWRRDSVSHARHFALWVLGFVVLAGCTGAKSPPPIPIEVRPPREGLVQLHDQPNERFVAATLEELPGIVQLNLNYGALGLFRPEVLPFAYNPDLYTPIPRARDGDAKIRVFAASDKSENDLVELKWQHRQVPIRWVHRDNVYLVEFPLDSLRTDPAKSGEDLCLNAQAFMDELIQLRGYLDYGNRRCSYDIKIPWPKTLTDGMEFTSNDSEDFEFLREWQMRVDVLIDKDLLKCVTYHKNPQAGGFLDGSKYFPEDFRKTILERMHASKVDEEKR